MSDRSSRREEKEEGEEEGEGDSRLQADHQIPELSNRPLMVEQRLFEVLGSLLLISVLNISKICGSQTDEARQSRARL